MISQPVFFPRDDWVADHADWGPRIQTGKTVDVASGDGRRIFAVPAPTHELNIRATTTPSRCQ